MKKTYLIAAMALLVGPSYAQDTVGLKIADGSSSGIYHELVKQINGVCGDTIQISEVPASGAIENLDKVIGNEANAAFLHSDVIFFRNQRSPEDVANIKTLLPLFKEDIHILALNRPYKQGGWSSYTSRGRVLDKLEDLQGLKVGAAGGGFVSANVIKLQSNVPYEIVQFNSGTEVMAALNDGTIAAAVFVGPAPLPNLANLDNSYKLLTISESARDLLKAVYRPTSITYTKMSPTAVQSVAADSLLVARVYKTPKFKAALQSFRSCFYNHLTQLQETAGTHKAWSQVDPSNHGKWQYYEFGNTNQ